MSYFLSTATSLCFPTKLMTSTSDMLAAWRIHVSLFTWRLSEYTAAVLTTTSNLWRRLYSMLPRTVGFALVHLTRLRFLLQPILCVTAWRS